MGEVDVGEDPGAVAVGMRAKVPGEDGEKKEMPPFLTNGERHRIPTRFKIERSLDRVFGGGKTKKRIFNAFHGFCAET